MASVEISQEELLRDSEEQLGRISAEARRIAGRLSPDQLQWAPPDGGWSVAQVFAHLATANESYVGPLHAAIERERSAERSGPRRSWKPSFFGGLLIRSLEPSAKRGMPSPRIWRPTTTQPRGSVEAFLASQDRMLELLRSARAIDLMRARVSSPVSRLIRMNAGDVFRVIVVHDWRHLGQVERVILRSPFANQ